MPQAPSSKEFVSLTLSIKKCCVSKKNKHILYSLFQKNNYKATVFIAVTYKSMYISRKRDITSFVQEKFISSYPKS